MDNQKRVAMVRIGTPLAGDAGPQVQYHLGDHLGSSNIVVAAMTPRRMSSAIAKNLPYGETSFGSFGGKRYGTR